MYIVFEPRCKSLLMNILMRLVLISVTFERNLTELCYFKISNETEVHLFYNNAFPVINFCCITNGPWIVVHM